MSKIDFKLRLWPVVTCWLVRPIRDSKTSVESKWDDNDKGKTKCTLKPDPLPLTITNLTFFTRVTPRHPGCKDDI